MKIARKQKSKRIEFMYFRKQMEKHLSEITY